MVVLQSRCPSTVTAGSPWPRQVPALYHSGPGTCCKVLNPRGALYKSSLLSRNAAAAKVATRQEGLQRNEGLGPAPAPSSTSDTICWTSYWWPVQAVASLNPKVPVHADLLGKSMAVWGDSKGNWHCMEDKCPHRLAPLSEGRVEKDNIMCCYHGWTFSGDGSCTSIPQLASDPKAHDNACSSKRSCVTAYPTRVENGLLWVWPEAGPEAAATAASTAPHTVAWNGMNAWYVRDVPLRVDMLLENIMDPSHLPYVHHGVLANRNKPTHIHANMHMSAITKSGMVGTGSFKGRPSYLEFQAPMRTIYYSNAQLPTTQVLCTPTKPGWSRIFLNTPKPSHSPLLPMMPLPVQWWFRFKHYYCVIDHVMTTNAVFDGDDFILHVAGRLLPAHKGLGTAVTRAYYMPAPYDKMVVALREWFQRHAGEVPTCSVADEAAMVAMSKTQVLDRWNQHTKQCSHCLKALATLDKLQAVNAVVGIAAAVALVAQAAAASALANIAGASAAAVAGGAAAGGTCCAGHLCASVARWWQACGHAGIQGGMLGCAFVALLSWSLSRLLANLRQKFIYEGPDESGSLAMGPSTLPKPSSKGSKGQQEGSSMEMGTGALQYEVDATNVSGWAFQLNSTAV